MRLKLLPLYTGKRYNKINQILADKSALEFLWLEILFNPQVPWKNYNHLPAVKKNYIKASIWQKNFKSLLNSCGIKNHLIQRNGKWNMNDYRKFIEALHYVS